MFIKLKPTYCYLILVDQLVEATSDFDPAVYPNRCRKYRLKTYPKNNRDILWPFRCEDCQKNFNYKSRLRVHLGIVHGIIL